MEARRDTRWIRRLVGRRPLSKPTDPIECRAWRTTCEAGRPDLHWQNVEDAGRHLAKPGDEGLAPEESDGANATYRMARGEAPTISRCGTNQGGSIEGEE